MGTKTKNIYSVSEFIKKVKNTSSINKKYVIQVLNNTSHDQVSVDQYRADINKMVSCVSLIKDKARARVAFTIYEYFVKNKNNISIDDDLLKMLVSNFYVNSIYFSQAIKMTYTEVKAKLNYKKFQSKNSKFKRAIDSTHLERGLNLDMKKKAYDNMLCSLSEKKKSFHFHDFNGSAYVSDSKRICIFYLMRSLSVEDMEYTANTTVQYLGDKFWFDCLSNFCSTVHKTYSSVGSNPMKNMCDNHYLNRYPFPGNGRPFDKIIFFHLSGPNENYYLESMLSSMSNMVFKHISDAFVDIVGHGYFIVTQDNDRVADGNIDQFMSFSPPDIKLSNFIIKSFFDMVLGALGIMIYYTIKPADSYSTPHDGDKIYSEATKKLDKLKNLISQNRQVLYLSFYFSGTIKLHSKIPSKINLPSDKNEVEGSMVAVELCLNNTDKQLSIVNK